MIFKQLFDNTSSTYTYIISSGKGREALIIDPVIENTKTYLKVLKELNLIEFQKNEPNYNFLQEKSYLWSKSRKIEYLSMPELEIATVNGMLNL